MSVFPSISAPFGPCCEVDVTPATRYCGAHSSAQRASSLYTYKIRAGCIPIKIFRPPIPGRSALDKPWKAGIMKITKGRLDKRSSPVKLRCEEKLRNRHLAEWRFRPLMRIVTVNPKIWKVNVIGIGTPPLQRIPGKTARRCVGALGVQ